MLAPIFVFFAWLFGSLVALGIPGAIAAFAYFNSRTGWTRLEKSLVRVKGEEGDRPHDRDIDHLVLAFAQQWKIRGLEGYNVLEEVMPDWKLQFVPGETFMSSGKRFWGEAINKNMARIATRNGAALGRLALTHEMVHMALWNIAGEPDSDHEEDKWQGWTAEHSALVSEINSRFMENKPEPKTVENARECANCLRTS